MKMIKIGELAKIAGISVRSLHHYDELGLLKPSAHQSEHRLYNTTDVARLQIIISLKSIGFSLLEIKQSLQNPKFDMKTTLTMHQEIIAAKIDEYKNIHQIMRLMLSRLNQHQPVLMDDLLTLIKEIKQMESIYTKEQLQKLKDRYEQYGLEAVKEVENNWRKLFKQFETAKDLSLPPQSPEVQALAQQAQNYIDLFTGKDTEIEARLDQSYAQQQAHALETWGVKKDVFDYALQARKILKNK